jgi:DnaJ-class molecular chaperone
MSKRDYYDVLGLPRNATEDDIKKAYRQLSSAHHPDKHQQATDEVKTGHEAKFKEAKEAYEVLSDTVKRGAYNTHGHGSDGFQPNQWRQAESSEMDNILDQLRRARGMHQQRQFKQYAEFNARVSLEDAYKGFEVEVKLNDQMVKVKVRPGTPNGFKTQHEVNEHLTVLCITRIIDDRFRIKDPTDCGFTQKVVDGQQVTVLDTGDIETTLDVDALDIILGAWVKMKDFLGEELTVRVPGGFNPLQRLRVKGKGYYNWIHELGRPETARSDIYVRINPIFTTAEKCDREKILALETITRVKS